MKVHIALSMLLLATVPSMARPATESPTVATTPALSNQEAFEQMARFTLAMEQVRNFYIEAGEEVSYETLIDGAIAGMMGKLDRYSGFMEGREARGLREQTQGRFGGVGVVISIEDGQLTIVSPVEDTPGWEAGLMTDDRILEIDGRSTRGISMQEVVEQLRGEPGTPVNLKIRRPSERSTFDVTLTRAVIQPRTVQRHRMLEDEIGYIRITQFAQPTARMLREELNRLMRQNPKGLVLDLRGNPGGLMESAVDVAGLFLPNETLVVYTKSREADGRKEYFSSGRRHELELPLVVLINQGSASGAEIVAAALKDHQRAKLVGQTTFGKGSVQSIMPLRDGSAIRLTTAIYYSPSDHMIHEQGVAPDVPVSMSIRNWSRLQRSMNDDWNWREDPQLSEAMALLLPGSATVEMDDTSDEEDAD
ncbi:MAG: S41 family peptidase [Verrucomicrobia bacterium]|nr:S41 family peptidase [Verrucomicrobiota bacterium]MCH8514013.1 S41 family peptidase [Kiritimatiellia bacterium]